jgi:hypothetical protein
MPRRLPEVPPLRPVWAAATACVAVALAFLAIFHVDLAHSPRVSFRHKERWQSIETLRVVAPLAPLGNSSGLYNFYAQLVGRPEVRELVLRDGPLHGSYGGSVRRGKLARPHESVDCTQHTVLIGCRTRAQTVGGVSLAIEGTARSKAAAVSTAARASGALRVFLRHEQDAAKIPTGNRVTFVVVDPASNNVERLTGHRLLGPLVALALILALLGLVTITSERAGRFS